MTRTLLGAMKRAYDRLFDQFSREQSLKEEQGRFAHLMPREVEVMDLVVDG